MSNLKQNLPKVEEMLEKGVHFGHQTKRWNPLMKKYIYSADHKTHIIDVFQTMEALKSACEFLYSVASKGEKILIVGSKRQATDLIENIAKDSGSLFVNQRWLGGTFTNFNSIKYNWEELNRLKEQREKGELKKYTKKERLLIDRKIEKLDLTVGGINGMVKFPGAMIVIDVKREKTAVREANAVNVPVIGIVDTNSSPEGLKVTIPANDDAIKSLELLLSTMGDAIKQGYQEYAKELQSTAKAEQKAVAKEVEKKAKEQVEVKKSAKKELAKKTKK